MTWPDQVVAQQRELLRAAMDGRVDRADLVPGLEQAVAGELGVRHVIAATSGTAAFQAVLLVLGSGPGRDVVVPGHGWISVGGAAWACGADVRIAPIGAGLTPEWADIAPIVGPRTAAVVLAHIHGSPAPDARRIAYELADREIPLIEDCAQAWGMRPRHWRPGCLGKVAIYSLQAAKLLSAEEGGLVATNDDLIASRVRHLIGDRSVSRQPSEWRLAFRMTWMQAALATPEVAVLHERVARLRALRAKIVQAFRASALPQQAVPWIADAEDSGTHFTTQFCSAELARRCRDELCAESFQVALPALPSDEHLSTAWPGAGPRAATSPRLLSLVTPLVAPEEDATWIGRASRALERAATVRVPPRSGTPHRSSGPAAPHLELSARLPEGPSIRSGVSESA